MTKQSYSKSDLAIVYGYLKRTAESLLGNRRRPLKAAGKTPDDYASETILRFLENQEKFDPTKRTLAGYLTNHLLRYLISDDFRDRKRDSQIKDSLTFQERHELNETGYLISAYLEDQMDYDLLVPKILNRLQEDDIALKVYNGRYLESRKVDDICEEHRITREDVYKSMKRIGRVLYKIREENNIDNSYGK